MCDPLSIAGVVATVGSLAANSAASGQVASARNDAMAAERIRQKGLDDKSAALNAGAQDRYKGAPADIQAKGGELGDYFGGQTTAVQAGTPAALPASSSNVTVQEQGKQGGKADAFNAQQGDALGNLRAFGDVIGGLGRQTGRDAQTLGQIGTDKRISAGILPHELEDANSAGDGLSTLGDILGGAGQLATTAGLSGAKLPGFGGYSPVANISAKAGTKLAPSAATFGGLNPYSIY